MLYPCKRTCRILGMAAECQNPNEPIIRNFSGLYRTLGPVSSKATDERRPDAPEGGAKCKITIMFCDIRGFSRIAEDFPADALILLLNEHFTAMTESLAEHQGALDKCFGDEFVGVFASSESLQEAALRCIRAALAMQARNYFLNHSRRRKKLPVFSLGIGINSGTAIAGYVGSPWLKELTVVGDAVNTAQRLCSIAKPGQILAGDTTYKLVESAVNAEAIGPVMLRGKAKVSRPYEIRSIQQEKMLMCE